MTVTIQYELRIGDASKGNDCREMCSFKCLKHKIKYVGIN